MAPHPVSDPVSRVDYVARLQHLYEGQKQQMAVIARYGSAGLSDPGRKRENNEDRFHADSERGIFFVIDGVGGQAAGEKAADTAHALIRARLERQTGTAAERIREAITLANNEIFRLSQENDEWHGMACVLTVALVDENEITIGQVGDSRLYLIQPGDVRKVTHDHSPVGEREDRGEIDEITAMRHPRRNEVYRDVGSAQHSPDDIDFVEISTSPFPTDSAVLLCSDGLSDLVTSKHILEIVEMHAGNPHMTVRALVDAANDAGGKDNITVVVVEGPRFAPAIRRRLSSPRTTIPIPPPHHNPLASRFAFVLYGFALALVALALLKPHWRETQNGVIVGFGSVREPRSWRVTSDISAALANALPGDTVVVAPGTYPEQIRLKDGVKLISERPREAVIRASGVALTGDDLYSGRVEGFKIQHDDSNLMQVGIQLTDSSIEFVDNEITGALSAGIELLGTTTAVIRGNTVIGDAHAAVVVRDSAQPRIVHNVLSSRNHPAVVIMGSAKPVLSGNLIHSNEPLFAPPDAKPDELLRLNFVRPIETPRPAKGRNLRR